MAWRVIVTAVAWFLGTAFQLLDGQFFRNAMTMLVAVAIGCAPWVPLAFSTRGTRGRVAAILLVSLSAMIIILIAIDLPGAYQAQQDFNQRLPRVR